MLASLDSSDPKYQGVFIAAVIICIICFVALIYYIGSVTGKCVSGKEEFPPAPSLYKGAALTGIIIAVLIIVAAVVRGGGAMFYTKI